MTHIAGFERDQLLLLPEAVDDYVGADNPVRFIDAFVDGLDLAAAGFARVEAKATGRPGYAPGDLLKLYIYGYLNRVRSSRRLERECRCNVEVMWLLQGLKPDFKTIADFRRDNRAAFRAVFRQFVLVCRRLDLFGRELLAVDGTRIKAVNNKDRNYTRSSLREFIRAADERLNDYLERLDRSDAEDGATRGGAAPGISPKRSRPCRRSVSIRLSRWLRNRSLSPSARIGTGWGRIGLSSRFERESQPRRRRKSRIDPAHEIASFFANQAQFPAKPNTLDRPNPPKFQGVQSFSRATSVPCGLLAPVLLREQLLVGGERLAEVPLLSAISAFETSRGFRIGRISGSS
jgi:transposase